MPQLAEFVCGFTQVPPQSTSGKGQVHEPELQSLPPPQAMPHWPQLLLSHLVSMHVLPQSARPPGHEQVPFSHAVGS